MAQALEDRIARDEQFASDVSHELRSPLMTLSASIEVLKARRGRPRRAGRAAPSTSSWPTWPASSSWSTTSWRSPASRPARPSWTSTRSTPPSWSCTRSAPPRPVRGPRAVRRGRGRHPDPRRQAPHGAGRRQPARQRGQVRRRGHRASGSAWSTTGCASWSRTRARACREEVRQKIFDRFARGTEAGRRTKDRGVGLGPGPGGRARAPARRPGLGRGPRRTAGRAPPSSSSSRWWSRDGRPSSACSLGGSSSCSSPAGCPRTTSRRSSSADDVPFGLLTTARPPRPTPDRPRSRPRGRRSTSWTPTRNVDAR